VRWGRSPRYTTSVVWHRRLHRGARRPAGDRHPQPPDSPPRGRIQDASARRLTFAPPSRSIRA
jgi:hypothetical protein